MPPPALVKTKCAPKMERTRYPGIYKRGGRYVVVWVHRGKQHKSFHATLAEAREAKGQRNSGDRAPVTRQRFEDYALAWLDTYPGRTSRGLSDSTRAAYRDSIERLAIPHFGRCKLADVDPPKIRDFIAKLEASGQSAGSIRKHFAPLRAMLATAYEDGAIRSNPAQVRVVVRDGRQRRRPPTPTREQFPRLVAALPERWQLLVVFIGSTGVRIGEALGLEAGDLHLDGATPFVAVERQAGRGVTSALKTEASRREVPIPRPLADALAEHVTEHVHTVVFCTLDGRHLLYRNVLRTLHKALDDAGLREPGFGFHALRRMAASFFEAAARTDSQIAAVLGHADGGRLARQTYLRPVDGIGGALPDNVIALPVRGQRLGNGTPGASRNLGDRATPETPAVTEQPQAAARAAHDS